MCLPEHTPLCDEDDGSLGLPEDILFCYRIGKV